jgi:hypothetical protein
MDYSAHDSDLPDGGDPWASSPKHNRQSFGQPPTSDIPSSPLPPQASPYGQGSEQYGYMGDQDAHNRPNTASSNGDHPQPPQVAGQDAPQSQQQPQAHQQAPAQGQQPQRYHGTRPQRQQQHYKLQAKVTGLERNGKKDPILRFDVYVRFSLHISDSFICRNAARIQRPKSCFAMPCQIVIVVKGNCSTCLPISPITIYLAVDADLIL